MRIFWTVILSLVVFSGCINNKFTRAELAKRAQTEMLGMSKKDLLWCAGVPVRSQQVNDMEILTYYISNGDSFGYPADKSLSSAGGGTILINKRYCEVTFVMQNGVINKVSYASRTNGQNTENEQCAFVIQNCIPSK
ncbi:MAG: hypothetical protein AMJ60_12045 [Desulfobacterales bacterium SG8_35]|nr:MAG: hypothetical protein AMJ60_12045 [Desulfobacterales bacterium SG8_35]